jgi:hypothetical protein
VSGYDSHNVGKKSLGGKGTMRKCLVLLQQSVSLALRLERKSSHIFTQSPYKVKTVGGSDSLAYHDEFFANNQHYIKCSLFA